MRKHIILLFICLCHFSNAQEANTISKKREPAFLFSLVAGTNINLSKNSLNSNSKLLGTRPEVAPLAGFRITSLFSEHIGWYANFQLNFYKERRSELYNGGIIEEVLEGFVDLITFPVSIIYPAVDAGMVYRIEHNKWGIYPGIGLGYAINLKNRDRNSTYTREELEHSFSYKQRGSAFFINFGITTTYNISKKGFLTLNAAFKQPLSKSGAKVKLYINDVETDRLSYKSSTIGRALDISIGYGMRF